MKKRFIMKKWLFGLLAIILIILGVFFVVKSNKKSITREYVHVTTGSITEHATAVGSIVPVNTTTVKSQLEGIVSRIYHNSGDYVHKGDILLKLTPNPSPLSIAQYISQVDQYKAKVQSGKENISNFEQMLADGLISKNHNAYISAKAQLKADQAALLYSQQNLGILRKGNAVIDGENMGSIIKSPIDGYVLQRNVDLGDPVTPMATYQNATILYTIADMDRPIFQGTVDEIDAGKIKLGMPVVITIGALPKVNLKGKLTSFALQSDNQNNIINQKNGMLTPTSSTLSAAQSPFNVGFQVKVQDFKVPSGVKLRSGYSATSEIIIKKLDDILILPERSLVFKNNKIYVYLEQKPEVLLSKNKNKNKNKTKLILTEIKIGISDGINVQVLSGLSKADKVVVVTDESLEINNIEGN